MEYTYEQACFMIIAKAGDASSTIFKAFNMAQKGELETARSLVDEATGELNSAHEIQTYIIQEEAKGNKWETGVLMIHAQDHLMNAMLTKEMASHVLFMYEKMSAGGLL